MVEEPDVGRKLGVEATMSLEVNEKILPLLAVGSCDVKPQSLYASVMDTPRR